jgi:hypothetical protein
MCASSRRKRTQLIRRVLVLVHYGGSAAPSAQIGEQLVVEPFDSTIASALRFSPAATGRRSAASRVCAAPFLGLDGMIAASGDGS